METTENPHSNTVKPKLRKPQFKPTRPRYTPFSNEQKAILEEYFKKNTNPRKDATTKIASLIGLTQMQVKNWFNNTRQKLRRIHESEMEFTASMNVEESPHTLDTPSQTTNIVANPLSLGTEELTNPQCFPLIMPLLLPGYYPFIPTNYSTNGSTHPISEGVVNQKTVYQNNSCSQNINFSIEKLLSN